MRSDAEKAEVFNSAVGQDMGAACDSCTAHAVIETDPGDDCDNVLIELPTGVWYVVIRHDGACLRWRAMHAGMN